MRCQVTIVTVADGRKTRVLRQGELRVTPTEITLYYAEENAETTLILRGGRVEIVRKGDYTLAICLEKGKTLDGSLGIGGSEGVIQTKTERIGYSIAEDTFVLRLKYELLTGGEPQKMLVSIDTKGE